MATTPKGIYYPNNYNEIADIPEDMKKMAESIDEVFEDTDSDLSDIKEEQTTQNNRLNSLEVDNTTNKSDILTNKQDINNIKAEQTTQNTNIQINADNISALTSRVTETEGDISDIKEEQTTQNTNISTNATNIESLQEENENLKKIVSQLPQVEGQGTSITLENTITAQFTKFDVEGNSVQDGTPSPDNEVPILSAGDNIQLWGGFTFERSASGITFNQNADGTVTANGTATASVSSLTVAAAIESGICKTLAAGTYIVSGGLSSSLKVQVYDSNINLLATDTGSGSLFTLTEEKTVVVRLTVDTNVTVNNQTFYLKLEKGNKATPYSPYGMGSINEKIKNADGTEDQDYSIFVQQLMRSNKDKTIKDKFVVKSDNKKYERHYIREVVLNGTEEIYLYNDNGNRAVFYINVSDLYDYTNSAETPELLSNRFRPVSQTATWEPGGIACRIGERAIFFIFETGTTINDFKNWLSTHNVVVQYLLAEPLDLPCTETQIQQLENLPSTYKDFTIIQSQDETPAYLEVSGIRDINTMFDKVTNAIVSLGGNV